MKYDPALIKTKEIFFKGEKVKVQCIPQGMSGPYVQKHIHDDYTQPYEEIEYDKFNKNERLLKEYNEYFEEGIDPDSNEIRSIKEKIEKNYLFEEIDEIEDFDIE